MRKQVLPILLILLALLSGCSCAHEWTQADCLNPQTCVKCGETGEAALGHLWSAASCTQPQLCTRCSETQGEPLEHSFGEWSFEETEMTHICSSCGFTETSALDRAIQLESLLPGLWEFSGMFQDETFYSAYNLPVPGDSLTFGPGRSVAGTLDQAPFSGTWEFKEYVEEEDRQFYYFHISGENDRVQQMLYAKDSRFDTIYGFFANEVQVLFSRNSDIASTIAGTWGAEAGSSMYRMTFREDRTVTINLEEAFEGTWQLLPTREMQYDFLNDRRFCGIYIRYLKDGEECLMTATVYPPRIYGDDPVPEEFIADTITLTYEDTQLTFKAMTPEEISYQQAELEFQAESVEIAPQVVIGDWTSITVRTYNDTTQESTETSSADFTLSFQEDGTFTGFVDKKISGTWAHTYTTGQADNYSYMYTLTVNGKKLDLDVRYLGNGKLSIHIAHEDGYKNIDLIQAK